VHIDIAQNQQKEDWYLKISREDFSIYVARHFSRMGIMLCKTSCFADYSHLAEIMPIRFDIANGRIPAILDKTGVVRKRIFESGAVMLYLCQGYDAEGRISYPFDSDR
jgi:hypothetical protein